MAKKMGLLNTSAKTLSGNVGFLSGAFRSWLGFLGVREITRMSDEMQNLNSRLKLVTGSSEGAAAAFQEINAIANRTFQSVSGVGTVYNRLALSLRETGATTAEMNDLTETLVNSFRIAGATTTETVNTIIQLSQAFSSGELRGQELRSVMEQNATLAQILRERFGKDIYKKAADGAIGLKDVLEALAENQERINTDAKNLTPTFEQSLTKAMNVLSVAIGKVNEELGISAKFADIIDTGSKKISDGIRKISPVARDSKEAISSLAGGYGALEESSSFLFAGDPIATLTKLSTLLPASVYNISNLMSDLRTVGLEVSRLFAILPKYVAEMTRSLSDLFNLPLSSGADKYLVNIINKYDALNASLKGLRGTTQQGNFANSPLDPATMQGAGLSAIDPLGLGKYQGSPLDPLNTTKPKGNLRSLIGKIKGVTDDDKKLSDMLKELNMLYDTSQISLGQYLEKLEAFNMTKLKRELKEGKIDVLEYNEKLRDLRIQQLTKEFNVGALSFRQFNEAVDTEKMIVLNEQLQAGKINLMQYTEQLNKLEGKFTMKSVLYGGASSYIESIGTLGENISKGIESTFSSLENTLTDFIKTGKMDMKNFAQSILDELNKIIVRWAIVRPIAEGLMGAVGPSTGGGGQGVRAAAKGDAFSPRGVEMYAKGGVFDSPSMFQFGNNKLGVLGEKGPEAILPLQRDSKGNLGVSAGAGSNVVVNVINNASADVETRESTDSSGGRVIDVLIQSRVKAGFASGAFDKDMQANFGLRRRGT